MYDNGREETDVVKPQPQVMGLFLDMPATDKTKCGDGYQMTSRGILFPDCVCWMYNAVTSLSLVWIFFRKRKMRLHFISILDPKKALVFGILPRKREGPFHSARSIPALLLTWRHKNQDISSHGTDLVSPDYSGSGDGYLCSMFPL